MKKEYEFKFSIIMCVYNVEQYLEESIQSLLRQNIGFEENVHLIIVNDGSPDNSEEIILKYKERYPKNITYVKKENGGLSSAKNAGLEHIKGEYVNFFDPDDKLSGNALKEVYNFFKYNKLYVDIVSLPQYMFEAKTGLHPKYKYIEKTNHIIDLLKEPHNFVLSSCTSFYKHEIVKNMRFNEEMRGAEDTVFNYQIYKNNPKIGFVAEKGVRYYYRQRKAKTSILDTISKDKRGFITILNFLKLIDLDNLKDFEKEMIIYELRSRIFNLNKLCFDSGEEYENLLKEYCRYISAIEDEFIFYRSKWAENNNIKFLFAT